MPRSNNCWIYSVTPARKDLNSTQATQGTNDLIPFIGDSGCSTHLTNCKNLLRKQSSDKTEITFAHGKSITSSLKGTMGKTSSFQTFYSARNWIIRYCQLRV
jgi:hypothetical protein